MTETPVTQNHALLVLGKVSDEAQTVSGKCKAGDARYNGRDEREIEKQHENHLAELGLSEPPAGQPDPKPVQSVQPTQALHEALDPDNLPGQN